MPIFMFRSTNLLLRLARDGLGRFPALRRCRRVCRGSAGNTASGKGLCVQSQRTPPVDSSYGRKNELLSGSGDRLLFSVAIPIVLNKRQAWISVPVGNEQVPTPP